MHTPLPEITSTGIFTHVCSCKEAPLLHHHLLPLRLLLLLRLHFFFSPDCLGVLIFPAFYFLSLSSSQPRSSFTSSTALPLLRASSYRHDTTRSLPLVQLSANQSRHQPLSWPPSHLHSPSLRPRKARNGCAINNCGPRV